MKTWMRLSLAVFAFTLAVSAHAQKPPIIKAGEPLSANAFVELAKLINPAVVNISTSITPRNLQRGARDPFYDMLEQFYGFRMMPQQQRPQTALGTGFVIREDGLIVTNNHVIAGADKIQVQFEEKSDKMYDAKLIGSDDRTDIALIKIEGKNFPTVALGNSKDLEVGEWVAAFGNPLGQGHTMTKGIISAKGRDIGEINKFPLIQTDTPINPGNSGGPLVNLRGQVIGVNSAIAARAQGIGFAIPIDEVKSILPQLEKIGRIRKGYLGAGLAPLNPQIAMELGKDDLEGAVIAQVDPRGPAHQAGLRPYDVVTEFGGRKVRGISELMDQVADAEIGKEIKVKVMRDGKDRSFNVKIGERPEQTRLAPAPKLDKNAGMASDSDLGFTLAEPTEQIRRNFDLEADVNRPVVVEIAPGSKSARAGLLPGDVILDVNRKDVKKPADVSRELKKGKNTLRISRQGSVLFLVL
ncbi:MAG: trypsin-like peptidase domain-containing protein [Bdellovibrionaceae bacterium]|nr:trypsin-like peptidase domain-containing protein [Pseudobdellovibrionaceae bacterium]